MAVEQKEAGGRLIFDFRFLIDRGAASLPVGNHLAGNLKIKL